MDPWGMPNIRFDGLEKLVLILILSLSYFEIRFKPSNYIF